jgi:hypothetical protein
MKKFVLAMLAGTAFVGSAYAFPASDPYFEVHAGTVTELEVEGLDLNGGSNIGGHVGLDFGFPRIEAGVDRLEAEAFGGIVTIDSITYSGSALVDIPIARGISAFAGLGLDYTAAEANFLSLASLEADGWGWHYEVGGEYRMTDYASLVLSYKERESELDTDFGGPFGSLDTNVSSVNLGVKFRP